MIENRYLLIDLESGGVLHSTHIREVMVGLAGAFIDVLPYQLNIKLSSAHADKDFNKDIFQFSYSDELFTAMPTELITAKFERKREIARIKGKFIRSLFYYCEVARVTATLGVSEQIFSDLEVEIQKCRPEEGFFTSAIHEYAAIQNLEPSICLQELRVKVESARLLRIRNFAIYQKYLNIIYTSDELDGKAFVAQLRDELFLNSHV